MQLKSALPVEDFPTPLGPQINISFFINYYTPIIHNIMPFPSLHILCHYLEIAFIAIFLPE
jgi:hypothetical protein